MIWINDTYLKIWQVDVNDKFVLCQVSSSSKQQDGTYKNSSWYAKFLGKAKEDAVSLEIGDKVKVLTGAVENIYNKELKKSFLSVLVFSFEKVENSDRPYQADDDDELPF